MSTRLRTLLPPAALTLGLGLSLGLSAQGDDARQDEPLALSEEFKETWYDGQAEVAGYELELDRYSQARQGTAVAIFVTEDFTAKQRVKSDGGRRDEYPVIKLNLAKDFQTGVYDYNLMLSAFVGLAEHNGRPAGYPTKVSFSSQEWCGHVYHQLLFDEEQIRQTSHSYFDGEADDTTPLEQRQGGVSEDALLLWARGMASPRLKPGETRKVPLLVSTQFARLRHQRVKWVESELARAATTEKVTVPAGELECERYTVKIGDGRAWKIHVEKAAPHRIVQWQTSTGERGRLLGSKRLRYWGMSGNSYESALKEIGLSKRPPRTP